MRTIVIMGAASRDFNVVFRDDLDIWGAAFIIENRVYAIAGATAHTRPTAVKVVFLL
jgi:hypothetical protein